jgi:hypothetical protein
VDGVASRPLVRGLALASVLVALVGGLALLATRDEGIPSAGARVSVDGRATLVRVDGSTETLSSGDVVRAGEEVRAEAGTFVLELAEGGQLEGRAGYDEAPDSRVIVGERPEVVAGEVLIRGRHDLDVDAAGTIVALTSDDSAARVDRALAVRTATYAGGARIDSAGQERGVPALRQLGVASLGRPAGRPDPFVVDEDDPWDRRFLGGAMSLSRQLDAWSTAFSDTNEAAAASVELYETAVPALAGEDAFPSLLASARRSAGEVLIGTVLTALGDASDFAERWRAVFAFRDEGAAWGLVALDQGLDVAVVADAVGAALGRTGDEETPEVALGPTTTAPGTTPGATPPAGSGTTTTRPPGGTDGADPPGTSSTTPTTAPGTPTTTPLPAPTPTVPDTTTIPTPVPLPTLPPPEEPVPDTGVPLLDDVLEPIEDLLGGLLG